MKRLLRYGNMWPAIRKEVMERDHYICQYCGGWADEVDHIIPLSRKGPTIPENLVAVCTLCNHKAKNRLFRSFKDKKKWILWRRGFCALDPDVVELKAEKKPKPIYADEVERTGYFVMDSMLAEIMRPAWHTKVYGWGKHKKK